jgi:hypothetical protein
MMDDPKIEIYDYSEEKVNKSKEWAITTGIPDRNYYEGINNPKKTLFHCASQHGASGALGVMVMPHHDDPIGQIVRVLFSIMCHIPKFNIKIAMTYVAIINLLVAGIL